MNFLDESSRYPSNFGPPADGLDGLLHDFFHAELPQPWPDLKPPAEPSLPVTGRWSLMRSRLALAASVALLLLGQWFLAGKFATDVDSPSKGVLIGDRPVLDKRGPAAPKNTLMNESLLQEGEQPTKYVIDLFDRF